MQDRGYAPQLTGDAKARQRSQEHDYDEQMHGQGANPRPTKAPLSGRSASPAEYATSGMERALGEHADKVHAVRPRR